jgi:hypothetical protein
MMRLMRVGIGAAVVFIAFGVFAFLGVPRDTMPGLMPYIKSEKVFYEELVGISGPNTFYRRREITTTFHTQTEAMNFLKKAGIPEPDYGNWFMRLGRKTTNASARASSSMLRSS